MRVGESLRRHWSLLNIKFNEGVSEAELNSFESRYSLILPKDLRDYFLSVNGMPPEVVDDEMIRFWMLAEVKPLSQATPDYYDPKYVHKPESLFLFADYSVWSHAYAIRLESVPLGKNEVIIIGHQSPVTLSNSFSGFVDRYLHNKDVFCAS